MENNDIEKNPSFKDNDCKVKTANDNVERDISDCRTEFNLTDNNLQNCDNQVECKIQTNHEPSCSKILNDNNMESDNDYDKCHNKEQSYSADVELDGDINGNNEKDSPHTDLKEHNNSAEDTNSSSEESNDSAESNKTSDSSMDKLDKRYRQSTKSKTNNKKYSRKQSSTKLNSNNDGNKMNRENNSNNIINNRKCDICGQFLNDPELLYYQGHPQDAVEEYVALTDEKLVVTGGK